MKLGQFTIVGSYLRDSDISVDGIDKLLVEVRARIEQTIADVGEEHDIVLTVKED